MSEIQNKKNNFLTYAYEHAEGYKCKE